MAQVRKAVPGDVPTLMPLVAAYWEFEAVPGFESHRVAPQLERLLSRPTFGTGWIALEQHRTVGYLLAVYVFSLEHLGLTAEIDEFFVLPQERKAGVGSKLLAVAEAEFIRIGCTNVSLQLSRRNKVAREFYRRHNYGERSGYELLDKML